MDKETFESLLSQREWLRNVDLALTKARRELEDAPATYRDIYKTILGAELKIQESRRILERQFEDALSKLFD